MADGRILVGGQFKRFAGKEARGLVVLRPDGSVDPRFVSRFAEDGFSVGVACVEPMPDGRIIAGGYFTKYAGRAVGRYVILRPDGSMDTASTRKGGADSHVLDIDLMPDGSILLGGFFLKLDGHPTACVGRLLPDGRVDTEFSHAAGKHSVAYAVAGQADGKIVIGGTFTTTDGAGKRFLGRLTAEGKLDATFAANDGFDVSVFGVTLDPRGRIVVAGQFKESKDTPMPGLGRLLPDGSPDPAFTFAGETSASFFQS